MNNRSHIGMKPVLSLCQPSGPMACWVLPCWPVILLEEYSLRKKHCYSVVPWFCRWIQEERFLPYSQFTLSRSFWERIQGRSNGWRRWLITAPDKGDSLSQGKSQRISGLYCFLCNSPCSTHHGFGLEADSDWDSRLLLFDWLQPVEGPCLKLYSHDFWMKLES